MYITVEKGTKSRVAWPSGLRRWFKAPVSSEAWVRIPPLPIFFNDVSCGDNSTLSYINITTCINMIKYVLVSLQSKNAFRVDLENRHVLQNIR